MIKIKPGVLLDGLQPVMFRAIATASEVIHRYADDCVVTSGKDGQHMKRSKHYTGEAVDLRSRHIPDVADKLRCLDDLKATFGADFDILLENLGKPQEHYHLEYDPK